MFQSDAEQFNLILSAPHKISHDLGPLVTSDIKLLRVSKLFGVPNFDHEPIEDAVLRGPGDAETLGGDV